MRNLILNLTKGPTMTDAAKEALAEAKAAKAKAKALRPFYKKKRYWLLGVVILAIGGSALGSTGGSGNSTATGSESEQDTADTISSGIGSADASSDVVDLDCGTPDELGFIYPSVTVKNNSSKTSDYMITVIAQSSDGSTKYDETFIIINGLAPGQQMTEDGLPFTNDIPTGAECKITELQRTAS